MRDGSQAFGNSCFGVELARARFAGFEVRENTRIFGGEWIFDSRAEADDGRFELVPVTGRRDFTAKLLGAARHNPIGTVELERLGFLTHPHTSAGRVPTEAGYRVYVNGLLVRQESRPAEFPLELTTAQSEVDDALQAGVLPILIAGDPAVGLTTVPTVARLRPEAKILWLAARGAFHTPATSPDASRDMTALATTSASRS